MDAALATAQAQPSVQEVAATQSSDASIDWSKHPSGIIPTLQNIVATVNLSCKLDLKTIALKARNAEYNPKRFAAVIIRIREPKTTALVFASGKMVVTGAKSEKNSETAAKKFAKIVKQCDFPDVKFQDFKLQNIVGSCDVKFPIRLEGLAYAHGLFSSYEPELFPGLIYRMKVPKIVLLIFVSGKVVLTGAKFKEEIYQAFEQIYPVLGMFRKGDVPPQGSGAPQSSQAASLEGRQQSALALPAPASQADAGPSTIPPGIGMPAAHLPPPTIGAPAAHLPPGRPEGPQQTIKVCVLGRGSCGKTQLINRLVECPDYMPQQTLGLQVKPFRWPNPQKGHLQQDEIPTIFEFWEVGSAAALKDSSLLPAAKQSSAIALLVFSMTDRAGFNQLPELLECDYDVEAVAKSNKLPIFPLNVASESEGSDKTGTVYSAVYQKMLAIVEENLW
ncbi:hypothetical protein WJX77_004460 [Trebouxia sp. C0004]